MIRRAQDLRIGNGAQEIPNQTVELGVGNQMCRLLIAQRSA